MIDYISCEIKGIKPELLLNNPRLQFTEAIDRNTGEQIPDRYGVCTAIAQLDELTIKIKTYSQKQIPYKINITGSLHKYSKGNNFDDFSFNDLKETIHHITETLQIQPDSIILHQIEFGVNIQPPIQTKQFIDQIISWNGKEYELRAYNDKGYLKRFISTQCEFKIYDKGFQYNRTENILRVEIKATKMAYLQTKGIELKSVSDLLKVEVLQKLKNTLLTATQSLIFTDDRISVAMIPTKKERDIFKECSNPRFWVSLRNQKDRKVYIRRFDKFDSIRAKYAPDDIKQYLQNSCSQKFDSLCKNVPFLPISKQTNVPILPNEENAEMSRFDTHIVCNKQTPTKRHCLTCGRDISNQKTNSQYCSEKTHGRQVKRCRNIISNFKIRENRFYPDVTLFDIDEFLKPENLRIKQIAFNTQTTLIQ